MDRMLAGVDGPAMLEGWIFGSIVTQHVKLQHRPGLKVGAGGEDLDLDRHDFIGPHRLALPMGVPGAPRSASLVVELAMRDAQPALGNAISGKSVIAIENDFAAQRVELPQGDKQVDVVALRGGHPQFQSHSAGDFGVALEPVDEAGPIAGTAAGSVTHDTFIEWCLGSQGARRRVEIEWDIPHARKWPVWFGANIRHIARSAHRQPDARRPLPAIRLALKDWRLDKAVAQEQRGLPVWQ